MRGGLEICTHKWCNCRGDPIKCPYSSHYNSFNLNKTEGGLYEEEILIEKLFPVARRGSTICIFVTSVRTEGRKGKERTVYKLDRRSERVSRNMTLGQRY